MGLLSLGTPLSWEQAAQLAPHVRKHGIEQLLSVWREQGGRSDDPMLWGDEIEYVIVVFDEATKTARLSLRQEKILSVLETCCAQESVDPTERVTFHPEYGRFMIESTPGAPFDSTIAGLLDVERNMQLRRVLIRKNVEETELPMTITSFPRLGVTDAPFTEPAYEANGTASHSLFLPDEVINTHVRFPTLTANIRTRRGSKVAINVPIYKDEKTPSPFIDPTIPWDRDIFPEDPDAKNGAALEDHIYLDAMGFGMGCCCLQVTLQAASIRDACHIYDQLIPITPLLMAVSAASPAYRGYLADVDCRWNIISGAVDDRTAAERGVAPMGQEQLHNSPLTPARRLRKSRYAAVDSYLSSTETAVRNSDQPLEKDEEIEAYLQASGLEPALAAHFAHLFIRDPLVIFSERIEQEDSSSMDHFENIQSTNWQTMRFKPPPHGGHIGWRVEFRPMEVQLTDFENAAFSVFLMLLTRAIKALGTDLYMPITQVDENMARAQKRDAVHSQKFFFRRSWVPSDVQETKEYSVSELFLGTDEFPGFVPLVRRYLDSLDVTAGDRARLDEYIDLIAARASGTLQTAATYIRDYVRAHPAYRKDSVISEEINYDLLRHLDDVERGRVTAPNFLPESYAGHIAT
ncbi:glutamate--cysteine ligase [Malassezia cuniculi]|uniref:Glutamate--cysteine ligase n=1 Tax=Malassezia cuniculi TaxID=948313 RepID=A0AAF0EN48_9BASI|nr:glutamate--cysteine ligase [Malassezia cuniculi]